MKVLAGILLVALAACSPRNETEKCALVLNILHSSNIATFDRGSGFIYDISSEIKTTPNNAENSRMRESLKAISDRMQQIDSISAICLNMVDELRSSVLRDLAEYRILKVERPKKISKSQVRKYDYQLISDFNKPVSFFPTRRKLVICLNLEFATLLRTLATYDKYSIQFPSKFNILELTSEKFNAIIAASNANVRGDGQVMKDLFDPMLDAERLAENLGEESLYQFLLNMESIHLNILSIRCHILAHISSSFSNCGYTFTEITSLAKGPDVVNTGDTVILTVTTAAYDPYQKPIVTSDQKAIAISAPHEGMVYVKFVATSGDNNFSGTVSRKNRSGITKTDNWKYTVYGKN